MTIKVFVSGICGSQDVRKQQQRVLFILSTMPVDLQIIDITEPGREEDRNFMQEELKKRDKKTLLPPQIFNDNDYCGDYNDFQLANDDDVLMRFLKLEEDSSAFTPNGVGHHEKDGFAHEVQKEEPKDEPFQETGEEIINISDEKPIVNENISFPNEVENTASENQNIIEATNENETGAPINENTVETPVNETATEVSKKDEASSEEESEEESE